MLPCRRKLQLPHGKLPGSWSSRYTINQKVLKIQHFHRSLRIDLAECREMTYLCGMKKLITLRVAFTLVILASYCKYSEAQQFGRGFTPEFVPNFCDSVGAHTLKFSTSFYWYSGSDTNQNFKFVGYQGITCSSSGCVLVMAILLKKMYMSI